MTGNKTSLSSKNIGCIISLVIAVLLLALLLFVIKPSSVSKSDLFAMDTYMHFEVYGKNSEEVISKITSEINAIEKSLSVNIEDSFIHELNEKKTVTLDLDTYLLLKRALVIGQLTDSDFDIAIYPAILEWGFTTNSTKVPKTEDLEKMRKSTVLNNICFDDEKNRVTLLNDCSIDLGAIAKGYSTERIDSILNENGIKCAIINLGGNVFAKGKKPDGTNWNIGVKDPVSQEGYLCVLSVSDKAVITSGAYERYFEENGKIYHHIIDPKTLFPSESGVLSVSVISKDPTLADALSTALFVKGIEKATEFYKDSSEDFEFVMLTSDNKLYVTEGLKDDITTDYQFQTIKK